MKLSLWRRALRDPVAQNALALYAVDSTRYLLVLAIVAYLSRVLAQGGSDDWGLFLFYQSFAFMLALFLEYGLDFSATREVARWRGHRTKLARIAIGVVGVKGTLLAASGLVVAAAAPLVPQFRQHPSYLLWAWLWAAGMGLRPLWYFQGIEKLRLAAAIDIACRLVGLGLVFVFVRRPGDGWRALALYAVAAIASSGLNLLRMYRRLPFRWPGRRELMGAFRDGFSLFVYRGAVSLYTVAGTFILGLMMPGSIVQVGLYGGAERIVRPLQGLLAPLGLAFYPRISHLAGTDRPAAARLARISLAVMLAGATGICLALLLAGPLVVRVMLGPEAHGQDSIRLFRILALTFPMVAIGSVLGLQWMLPLGLDRALNGITIAAGALNLALAVTLVPRQGPDGMAWAAVVTETFVCVSMYWHLRRRKLDPLLDFRGGR